jgi:hypothetical protein
MRRLIVNPGTDCAWEIPLKNQTVTLGRQDGNDFVVDDPSVSSHHCDGFIPSIMKVLGQYLLTVVVLAVVLLVRWLLHRLLGTFLPIPLLPTIITSLIGLYLLVVEMRILGLLYRNNKDRLGWI